MGLQNKASLKHPHFPEHLWFGDGVLNIHRITPENHSSGAITAHTDQVHCSLLLSENFRLRAEEEGLGLERSPAPSEQDGRNSLWPQSAVATSLSVSTANKTSTEVAKG